MYSSFLIHRKIKLGGKKMSIQEPDQNCVSSGDRGGFFIPSDTERDWAGEETGERVGIQQKRLRGALDGLFRAVRCESESVRPEHISTLVEIIVRNFRKKETSVSWAHGDQDGGRKDGEVTGELDCPGCSLFIAEPVTVACGHSYCRSCLEQAFLSKCKKCQEELGEKHLLRANVVLCGLLEKWFPEEIHKTKRVAEVKELLRSKHFSPALSLATQLLDSDPSNIRLRVCRSEAYRCLQHYHHALEDLDMCVSVAPSVEVVFCKAKLLKEMGRVDESVKLCLQCLCVDQEFQEARQEVENILCDLLVPTCESVQTLEECSEPSGLIRAQSLRAHMVGGVRGEGLKRVSSAPQLGDKGALLKRKLSGLEVGPEVVETSDTKHKKHGVISAASACSDEDNLHLSVPRDLLDPSDFECSLCMRLFYEPVTTPCGHSFCKSCLQRSLDHSPQCPLCKESLRLYLASRRFSVTRVLDDIIKSYLCEEHAGRQKIHNDETKELSDLENNVPIFVCTMAYPTVPCPLHVFEPRYRLMIRRCIETGTRQFGMCISDAHKGFADFGCMLHIRNVHFLPDGRSVVDTFGGKRFHVITRSMRDGYYIANIEYLQDQRVEGKEELQLQDLYDQVYNHASVWFHSLENRFRNQILQHFGPMPEKEMDIQSSPNGPACCWWLLAVLPVDPRYQLSVLSMTTLRERLVKIQHILAYLQNTQHERNTHAQ
ncbi:LON peptidase N-terminal domain and ring finger 1, like isoform X2 [Hemibagrus wyckioides]|nr:LON peptidase N-terminal domain and ring finger 1, like isoform X2 [Hemibagrus wyckioides]